MDAPSERNRPARCEQALEDWRYNNWNFIKVKMIIKTEGHIQGILDDCQGAVFYVPFDASIRK